MRETTILKLAGLVGLVVFVWALVSQVPPPQQNSLRTMNAVDIEELTRTVHALTTRVDADIYDVLTWREMARLFSMCPDPEEAVRAWALVAPASLIEDRAGAAIARFWTAADNYSGSPLQGRLERMSREAIDELREFIGAGGDRVTVMHWRALAWTLTMVRETEEAGPALDMMREIAAGSSAELPPRVSQDVVRSMSVAWMSLSHDREAVEGWRLLAAMMYESGEEYPELTVSWRAVSQQFARLREDTLAIATIPHIMEIALHRNDEGAGTSSEWRTLSYNIANHLNRGAGEPWRTDEPDHPLGRPAVIEACDRIEAALAELGLRGVDMVSLLGWVRTALNDEEGAMRAWRLAAELQERRIMRRPEHPQLHFDLACSLALVGRSGEALDALERAVELGRYEGTHIRREPALASLRDTDRFVALVERADANFMTNLEFPRIHR